MHLQFLLNQLIKPCSLRNIYINNGFLVEFFHLKGKTRAYVLLNIIKRFYHKNEHFVNIQKTLPISYGIFLEMTTEAETKMELSTHTEHSKVEQARLIE